MSGGLPEKLGKYQVRDRLGVGGMGAVYRAYDPESERDVALKVLSDDMAAKPNSLKRFQNEARHGSLLEHENIVALYEFHESQGTHFLAMEYVDGIDLLQKIQRLGRLDPEEARDITLQIARALDHIHGMGMVHRDIKPSNILLGDKDGRLLVKLADLGLARITHEEEFRVTKDGCTVGTVDYLSPEQARDSRAADIRSDLYSLGCTLYHMLAGTPPFSSGTLTERLFQHAETEPADLRRFNAEIPDELIAICGRLLAKKPDDRYQTPAELIAALAGDSTFNSDEAALEVLKASGELPSLPVEPEDSAPAEKILARARPDPVEMLRRRERRRKKGRKLLPPKEAPLPEPAEDVSAATDEQRRAAAGQYERAVEVLSGGNYDYGIPLLLACCQLDPTPIRYRRSLREAQKQRHAQHGSTRWIAWLRTLPLRVRLKKARGNNDPTRVLELGEQVLTVLPDDVGTQLDMATAAESLGFRNLAIWMLEQARHSDDASIPVNRALALLQEKQKDYAAAIQRWERVLQVDPGNVEAREKTRELSVRETIDRGRYREMLRPRETG